MAGLQNWGEKFQNGVKTQLCTFEVASLLLEPYSFFFFMYFPTLHRNTFQCDIQEILTAT